MCVNVHLLRRCSTSPTLAQGAVLRAPKLALRRSKACLQNGQLRIDIGLQLSEGCQRQHAHVLATLNLYDGINSADDVVSLSACYDCVWFCWSYSEESLCDSFVVEASNIETLIASEDTAHARGDTRLRIE